MIPRNILAGLLVAAACCAHAGPRAVNAVFLDMGTHALDGERFYEKFVGGDFAASRRTTDCWDNLTGKGKAGEVFGRIARTRGPQGLDPELGRKIWRGNSSAIRKARKILQDTPESRGAGGIDGLYIFDSDGQALTMISVGTHHGISSKVRIDIRAVRPEQAADDFSYALCRIGEPLMMGS